MEHWGVLIGPRRSSSFSQYRKWFRFIINCHVNWWPMNEFAHGCYKYIFEKYLIERNNEELCSNVVKCRTNCKDTLRAAYCWVRCSNFWQRTGSDGVANPPNHSPVYQKMKSVRSSDPLFPLSSFSSSDVATKTLAGRWPPTTSFDGQSLCFWCKNEICKWGRIMNSPLIQLELNESSGKLNL